MRKYYVVILLMLVETVGVWLFYNPTLADSPLPQNLSITQIKISGDEFVVLRNNTDTDIQLSSYWLEYFNEASLSVVGVSNSSLQLPDAKLQPHREIVLSAGLAPVCGQVLVAKLSFALKDSAGLLQVVAVNQVDNFINYRPEDQVSWSNAKTNNLADLKLPSSQDSKQVWFRNSPQAAWQSGLVDYNSACSAASAGSSSSGSSSISLESSSATPPYIVLGASAVNDAKQIPASDIGLMMPQISEILPNPAPPQTDASNEFVELYNPNDRPFDLSGFILRSGTSATHEYTFPDGESLLQPKSFAVYYVTQTGLTLSNTSGRVQLLDPAGNLLTETELYSSAKDGQAWILAGGKWQWTTTSTPGSTNTLTIPASSKKLSSSAKASGSKKGAKGAGANSSSSSAPAVTNSSRNLHPLILAAVGGLALLYAGYEYRNDVANALYRLRRHRAAGRDAGQVA